MNLIKNSNEFKNILLRYDIILFDIFGVIWDGEKKINGSSEVLKFLKDNNKKVFFVSNDPQSRESKKRSFENIDIKINNHYDEVITSGFALNQYFDNNISKNFKNCYVFGFLGGEDGIKDCNCIKFVKNIEETDFIYAAFPLINKEEYNNLTIENKKKATKCVDYLGCDNFNILDIDLYRDKIKNLLQYNLPMISNCHDLVAQQPKDGIDNNGIVFAVRHGSVMKEYKNLGGKTIDISKPDSFIYKCTFDEIKKIFNYSDEQIKNSKILMVGDTINTDILGANNATKDLNVKVDSLLTLSGVSNNDFCGDLEAINMHCKNKNLKLNYIVDSLEIFLK